MTDTSTQQISGPAGWGHFLAALAPRLPRMVAVTAVVMFTAFAAIQFIPQTFQASLALNLPAGGTPASEADKLTDQHHLADVVSRLSPDIVAELRRDGGGTLDTTALLRKRLVLTPAGDDTHLNLAAHAATPTRARAILDAMTAGYASLAAIPPALSASEPAKPAATNAQVAPTVVGSEVDGPKLLQERLSLAWEDRIRLESRTRRIESLIADGNYAMLALDAENLPGLGRTLDSLAALQSERDRLAVDLLPNHPKMRTITTEIDRLSADLSSGLQQLASLAKSDRDAARRLEDSLRDQLASASTVVPAEADTSFVTGSIDGQPEPKVIALPRPVRTDLVLGFSGGLAFFGQIGLFAFLRSRRNRTEPEEVIEPVSMVAADEPTEHNWLETVELSDADIAVTWAEEPPVPPHPVVEPAPPSPAVPTAPAPLDNARIVAMQGGSETAIASRKLLNRYESQGRSVVLVDAATRRRGHAPGISDLSLGLASFADIVHGSGAQQVALVPWGRQAQLDPGAKSVRILIQALAEIYDVVILSLDGENRAATAPLAALADLSIDAGAVRDSVSVAA